MSDKEITPESIFTRVRSKTDFATVLGMIFAIGMVVGAMYLGGSITTFVDVRSILMVLGGTFAITTTCFSFHDMAQLPGIIGNTISRASRAPDDAAMRMIRLAEFVRKNGVLPLEVILKRVRRESFLYKSLAVLVDSMPSAEIERLLTKESSAISERHERAADILRRAAEIAPAMGLIGTLVGLVQMLGHLDDPSQIGPNMALALLTTLYGALLANVVFMPLAAKLDRNSAEENLLNQVYLISATSIARKENPRKLELMLNTVLPPTNQIHYFE